MFLLEPSAVSTTGGTIALPTLPTDDVGGGSVIMPPLPTNVDKPEAKDTVVPYGGGIFGDDSATVTANKKSRESFNNPATSALNLIGKLEGWGIGPATKVADVSIKVSAATGAQLKELLKKLPDGMTFELNLEKEGN